MSVRVYVEGGGTQANVQARCRRGFAEFFKKLLGSGPQPAVIACGARNAAFGRFVSAIGQHPEAFVILLVDSEGPVASGHGPWQHLRQQDGWRPPAGTVDDQAHLMVQCMESWFLADRAALGGFYQPGFRDRALPGSADIEAVPVRDVQRGLAQATREARSKGQYDKTGHGFALLAVIDPARVRAASPFAERLYRVLARELSR